MKTVANVLCLLMILSAAGLAQTPQVESTSLVQNKLDEAATKPIKRFINSESAPLGGDDSPPVTLQDTVFIQCPGNSVFGQPPHLPDDYWLASPSDLSMPPFKVYDNYAATDTIRYIHWWGLMLDNGGQPCNDYGVFDITFYFDNGMGMPDTTYPVYYYPGIIAQKVPTGFSYSGFPLWRFDLIDPWIECELQEGWISIQGSYDDPNCCFFWMSSGIGDMNS